MGMHSHIRFADPRCGAGKLAVPCLLVLCFILILTLQYGFIFLLVALLPSTVAWYTDEERGKPTFKIIFASNMAGTLPSVKPMLISAMHLKQYDLSGVIDNPMVWLLIYGSAAGGWGLLFFCRSIARFIAAAAYSRHIATLEKLQQKLIDEWGTQIKRKTAADE